MPLITVSTVKSSPGATTTALALAAILPASTRPLVIEADPAGGDLAARHHLPHAPGLLDLATTTRTSGGDFSRGHGGDAFDGAAQTVTVGGQPVQVVVAPAGGGRSRAALPVLARAARTVLAPADRIVIADCGRLDPDSPARPLLAVADVVLVLVRGDLAEIAHLREHLADLQQVAGDRLAVIVAAGGVYGPGEVADVLSTDTGDIPVLGALPHDRKAAGLLAGQLKAGRGWRRLPLFRALEPVAAGLAARITPTDPADQAAVAMGEPQEVTAR